MPKLRPPAAIRDITKTLERAGHEAWCVGGAVRDALLGIDTLDWDIATSARPEQVQKLFKRTIPVGIQFGTVGVFGSDGVLHEVTTFRHDVETDGRHAVVKFGASLEEDLARRDFTINAIAVHAETLELRDPFDGRADLERGVVRCVGVAQERMREDRLRALRALRFAGRFNFALDADTWAAIKDSSPHLGRLSMERVKQELEKVMDQVARPSATLERYREAGIFAALVPALADAPAARFAAVDHLARPGLARRPDRRMLRLAALFVEPGVTPSRTLETTLKALKFSNVEARAALTLAESAATIDLAKMRELAARALSSSGTASPAVLAELGNATSAASAGSVGSDDAETLRRMIARAGRLMVPGLTRLLWARAKADGVPATEGRAGIALYRRALRSAFTDPLTIGDLAIDGEDMQKAGVAGGRAMGQMLKHLLDVVLRDPTRNTREALLAEVAQRKT
jgi:tRNA nucleotidyltransferase (CCA-adding enzyme)